VIPHLTRMLVGPDYRRLMPASILIGGIFLLLVDNVARNLFQVEIPLGILTAVIGAPFFVYLLIRGRKGWL
jgi:iron complex transport system permease protein